MEKHISSNLYQMFESLQEEPTKCAPRVQYELNSFVTMTTYTVLGFRPPEHKRHFWPPLACHFHIVNGASYAFMTQQAYIIYVSSSLWSGLTVRAENH